MGDENVKVRPCAARNETEDTEMTNLILSKEEKAALDAGFAAQFGCAPERYFSAPGRTEIGGNHTDHQRGRVLAAAVNLDTRAAVRVNGTDTIRIQSKGYPMSVVNVTQLQPVKEEENTTPALIRGVAARFSQLGCKVQGFDAYVESTVLPGSGLSSSAAYEVLIGTIINHLFFDGRVSQPEVAMIGQYAENVFFGKPCGLMDQTASAVGNLVTIDFFDKDNPVIEPVDFDFAACGHALCIIDSRASHADLTDEYAAITQELRVVCQVFRKEYLRDVPEEEFYNHLPQVRAAAGDRAALRAMHVYAENRRVESQIHALRHGDMALFLQLVADSGRSSWQCLQNVIPTGAKDHQEVAFALALAEKLLSGCGACRVHGGGFAGTIQAFVPLNMLTAFVRSMDSVLGNGACHVLSIRKEGGILVERSVQKEDLP